VVPNNVVSCVSNLSELCGRDLRRQAQASVLPVPAWSDEYCRQSLLPAASGRLSRATCLYPPQDPFISSYSFAQTGSTAFAWAWKRNTFLLCNFVSCSVDLAPYAKVCVSAKVSSCIHYSWVYSMNNMTRVSTIYWYIVFAYTCNSMFRHIDTCPSSAYVEVDWRTWICERNCDCRQEDSETRPKKSSQNWHSRDAKEGHEWTWAHVLVYMCMKENSLVWNSALYNTKLIENDPVGLNPVGLNPTKNFSTALCRTLRRAPARTN
jgi:hypothetical protein